MLSLFGVECKTYCVSMTSGAMISACWPGAGGIADRADMAEGGRRHAVSAVGMFK